MNLTVDKLTIVILSAVIWGGLYFLAKFIFNDKTPEFWSRLITFIHGSVVAYMGLLQCSVEKFPFNEPLAKSTDTQDLILTISLGYFIVDLIWCLYYQSETNLMVCHHIYSCVALGRILSKGYSGGQATCALGGLEVTNPLLQTRWFIRTLGYRDIKLFNVVELIFVAAYIIVRIVFGTYLFFKIFTNFENEIEFLVLTLLIYLMSWMFFLNICSYLYFKYLKGNMHERLRQIGTG